MVLQRHWWLFGAIAFGTIRNWRIACFEGILRGGGTSERGLLASSYVLTALTALAEGEIGQYMDCYYDRQRPGHMRDVFSV